MPIEYKKKVVVMKDVVSVEDAEQLLEWLQGKSAIRVDMAACTHVHPANLQVLMAAGIKVSEWPADPDLGSWIASALTSAK